jgi:hypothetical protein
MDFTSFLNALGTYAQDWVLANAYRLSGDGLPDHLAHGDTIGICGNGVY